MAIESRQEEKTTEGGKKVQRITMCSVSERDKIIARGLAVSPLEGKRAKIGEEFSPYFSDYAWIKNMVKVMTEWLECYILTVDEEAVTGLDDDESDRFVEVLELIREGFDTSEYAMVKEKEKVTQNPAKAVSEYVAEKLGEADFSYFALYVQIGCTEEQTEFAAYSLMLKDVLEELWKPAAEELLKTMVELKGWDKKLDFYTQELGEEFKKVLYKKPYMTSGFGALVSSYFPEIDWEEYVEKEFAESYLKLAYNPDGRMTRYIHELSNSVMRFNRGVSDMNEALSLYRAQDRYISNGLFGAIVLGLPDDVDLSPTSLLWHVGEAFAYSIEAVRSTTQGLKEAYK